MLELKAIGKRFAHASSCALQNITMNVKPNEFCILIGNNGSGKSTLMNIIAGFIKPSSGRIILDREDITALSPTARSRYISMACQNISRACAADLTVEENIALSMMRSKSRHLRCYKHYRQSIQQELSSLQAGLEEKLDTPMGVLSGGQQQMIATLMAVQNQPKLLLLDEHTSALDPKMQSKVMEFTAQQISQRSIATIMITHSLDDALRYGDRLIMMSRGNIILDRSGSAKHNLERSELLELFHSDSIEGKSYV